MTASTNGSNTEKETDIASAFTAAILCWNKKRDRLYKNKTGFS